MRNAIKFHSRVEGNFSLNCQRFEQILNACQQIPTKTINEREVEDLGKRLSVMIYSCRRMKRLKSYMGWYSNILKALTF